MELTLVKEHDDGGATYSFDMNDQERLALLHLGIITALEKGIKEGEKYADNEDYSNGEASSTL
jgi:hypothetical protein